MSWSQVQIDSTLSWESLISPTKTTISLDALQIPTGTTSPDFSDKQQITKPTISLDALQTSTQDIPSEETKEDIIEPNKTIQAKEELSLDTSKFTIDTSQITNKSVWSNDATSNWTSTTLMWDSHSTITNIASSQQKGVTISISKSTIIIWIVIWIIGYSVQRYLTHASIYPLDPLYQPTIDTIAYYEQEANNILQFNSYNDFSWLPLSTNAGLNNLQSIINASSINYIHKKNIIAQQFDQLSKQVIQTLIETDNLKTTIATHGWMDKASYELIKDNSSFSIQQSLNAVEIIKLSTALKTFYYLDSFINQFASAIQLEPAIVKQQMERIIARWEKDIKRYIESCYINPFEKDQECNNTNDFMDQYKLLDNNIEIDPQFVIAILSYINQKLEQSTIPNLIINFSNFDPRSDSLTLSIEVNTFQEDELALISKGILNPHIFVVTNLINLLKQSTLIKDSGIDIKTLKINKKNIKVWSADFAVNNSIFSFTVPIQQSTFRDISDYTPILSTP